MVEPAAIKADDRPFVFYDWMAGYGGPTFKRSSDAAYERRLVAAPRPKAEPDGFLGVHLMQQAQCKREWSRALTRQ